MKNKITILITLLIIGVQASKSVPVGTDLELIPAPRNLGININQASQKLTVNGAIALTNLGSNPVVISSQPSLFVKDNGLFYKSTLHANPFRIDLNDTNNSTFSNPTLVNPLIKGSISFDSSAKLNSFIVNGAVAANLFNGGLFRGDGSGLTNIVPSSLKAPDGSPNPALQVDNQGRVGIGTSSPDDSFLHVKNQATRILAQHSDDSFWSEFSTAGVNSSGATVRKWSVGSTGDTRSNELGGPNKFYVYQYSDKDDNTVNKYRMVIDAEGNTGIGTLNPTQKLEVTGNIKANNFIGDGAGLTNVPTSGITNLSIDSLSDAKTLTSNVFLGSQAGAAISSGVANTATGVNSLLAVTTGNNNTALGNNAGFTITTGSNNIAIGADTQVASATGNNQLNIGNLLTGTVAQANPDGTFSGGNLNINGGANIKGILDVDGSIVSRGKILSPNNPWILVHSENFQTTPVGWNNNTITDCGGKRILGGFNTSSTSPLNKTFDLSAHPHTHVMVKFNYYSLDSWDNEMGFLRIDGLGTWSSQNLVYNDDDRAIITNCGTGGYSSNTTLGKDRVITGEARIDHTSNTLSLNFGSSLNETPDLESYGIDNLEIWIKAPGVDVSLNPPDPGISGNCGPNGYYTIQASDLTNPGNYLDPRGVGLANADFTKCRNLLFVEGGHSVTRTWNFINPSTPGNVLFKIERRRSGSPGVGVRYWFPTNVTGIPNPMDITLPNSDINISCLYSNNSYSCTHSVTPL